MSCCPCILISVAGPHIFFAGFIWPDIPVVQPFTDYIYLGAIKGTPFNEEHVREVSKTFSIFKEGIEALKEKYRKLVTSENKIYKGVPEPTYRDDGPSE